MAKTTKTKTKIMDSVESSIKGDPNGKRRTAPATSRPMDNTPKTDTPRMGMVLQPGKKTTLFSALMEDLKYKRQLVTQDNSIPKSADTISHLPQKLAPVTTRNYRIASIPEKNLYPIEIRGTEEPTTFEDYVYCLKRWEQNLLQTTVM